MNTRYFPRFWSIREMYNSWVGYSFIYVLFVYPRNAVVLSHKRLIKEAISTVPCAWQQLCIATTNHIQHILIVVNDFISIRM